MIEIYALADPATGEIRYVGKAKCASARLKRHVRDSRRRDFPVYCWMRALHGLPALKVLATCADGEWQELERKWIADLRAQGARLLNVAEGGDEPHCSREVRAENGRRNAAAVHGDPLRRRAWSAKRNVGQAVRWCEGRGDMFRAYRLRFFAGLARATAPTLFGGFAP